MSRITHAGASCAVISERRVALVFFLFTYLFKRKQEITAVDNLLHFPWFLRTSAILQYKANDGVTSHATTSKQI